MTNKTKIERLAYCDDIKKSSRLLCITFVASLTLAGCATSSGDELKVAQAPSEGSGSRSLQPYTSQELDEIPVLTAPHFIENTPLPVAVAYEAQEMPPYMSAPQPIGDTPLSLEDIYQIARDNDPVLRSAYAELQAVAWGTSAARAGLLPNIGLEGNYSRVTQDVVDSENTVYQQGKASWKEHAYALTLTQPLFDLGLFQKWQQAKDTERREVANFAQAQQDLMLRTATAYLSVLAARDQLELTKAEQQVTAKQLELAESLYQSGQTTVVGLSEVQAQLDIQEANYLMAESQLFDRNQALQEITGYGELSLARVSPDLILVAPEPNDPRAWLTKAIEQNWAIRAAAAATDIATREISVQKSGHYPRVNVKASTGRNETGGSLFGGGSTVDDTRVMLSLELPLFQGGYTYAMSKAAVNRLSAAQSQLSLARRQVQRQVFSSYKGIITGMERITALQSSILAFEQALELNNESFIAGLKDAVSVLDATRNLYNAKRQEAEARYNYILDTLKLKQAAGILSDQDIVAVSNAVL